MAKRIAVQYIGTIYSRCTAMKDVPEGTVFKAVESLDSKGKLQGVFIRGSNLTKAAGGKHKFAAKQYLFLVNDSVNAMVVV